MVGASSNTQNIKFLCSFGGRILPRYPDGRLRYHGGETRVLSVSRSISFAELLVKLAEMCGTSVCLRCQLPTEDLDALVSITSDEDLANLIEEYDLTSSLKIRAFLSAPKTTTKNPTSPPSSPASAGSTSPKSPLYSSSLVAARCSSSSTAGRCIRSASKPPIYPINGEKAAAKLNHRCAYGSRVYVILNGTHYQ